MTCTSLVLPCHLKVWQFLEQVAKDYRGKAGFKGWLCCSNSWLFKNGLSFMIMWSLRVKLWMPQIGFVIVGPLLPQLGKISLFTCAHTIHSLEQHIIKVKILLHHFNMWTSIVSFNVIFFVSSFSWILSHVVLPQTLKTKLYYELLYSLCHVYICLVSFAIPTSKEFKDFLIICTKG
jgi:hypothetical protein